MNDKSFQGYIEKLLEKERQLADTIGRAEINGRETELRDDKDLADKASVSYVKEALFQQVDHDRAVLNLVREALLRAAEGAFGKCIECGREVEAKRLDAVPWTRYCIACQELKDNDLL